MVGLTGSLRASTMLLFIIFAFDHVALAGATNGKFAPWRIERDIQRFKTVAVDNVMELLAIQPEMTILDIGAGTGQFAFEFARKLRGTGKVFATDSNRNCVEYMKREADNMGLGNLFPVLVEKDGVDDFYGRQKYDLIAVFHVAMDYENQVEYFRAIKEYLSENGRLVLILYKIATPFSPENLTGDIRELFEDLSLELPDSPYSGILKDSTRKRLRDHTATDPSAELAGAVADDLNAILPDPMFAAGFHKGSVAREELGLSMEERGFADWMLLPYRADSVRPGNTTIRRAADGRMVALINKLLILRRYRNHFKPDGLFVSGFTPPIKAAFEKAGYHVQHVYTGLIPFEDLVVLLPDRGGLPSAP